MISLRSRKRSLVTSKELVDRAANRSQLSMGHKTRNFERDWCAQWEEFADEVSTCSD